MKIQTIMAASIFLVGSSVALANTPSVNHYDIMQDELWHGAETAPVMTYGPSEKTSVEDFSIDHYDVGQDEFWHGAETAPSPTASPSEQASENRYSVDHFDVSQDEFWHGG